MDAHSLSIPWAAGEPRRVDVPMRSFQGGTYVSKKNLKDLHLLDLLPRFPLISGYYRHLISLYKHLNVPLRIVDFTYSFSRTHQIVSTDIRPSMTTDFLYNGQNGKRGLGVPSQFHSKDTKPPNHIDVFGNLVTLPEPAPDTRTEEERRREKSALRRSQLGFAWTTVMTFVCYLRLILLSMPILHGLWGPAPDERMDSWAKRTRPRGLVARWTGFDQSWDSFVKDVVLTLFGAMCTTNEEDFWAHPVAEVLGELGT